MNRSDKIYVAGHRGMVGSAIWRILEERGFTRLKGQTHNELDLTSQAAVQRFFEQEKPDCVVLAAARVAGNRKCPWSRGWKKPIHGFRNNLEYSINDQ